MTTTTYTTLSFHTLHFVINYDLSWIVSSFVANIHLCSCFRSGGFNEQEYGVQSHLQVCSGGPLVLSYWLAP